MLLGHYALASADYEIPEDVMHAGYTVPDGFACGEVFRTMMVAEVRRRLMS